MAVYKVPQDVEADDKLIGPFSFRQFVFVLFMSASMYFAYLLGSINIVMGMLPVPFIIFFAALAFPWRKDQPTEVYLTALIHFWIKPRKRLWNQEGQIEHVVITAPKKVDHQYTDGMSNTEVRSRLHTLASTLDSRGWAAKNVAVQDVAPQGNQTAMQAAIESDRIAMPKVATPVQNQAFAVTASDDVLDVTNNSVAQNFDHLVNQSAEDHKNQLLQQMQQATTGAPATQDDPKSDVTFNPYPADMQQATITPSVDSAPVQPPQTADNQPVSAEAQGAIINLANNSDLNVSTIARQAEQAMQSGDTIELH